MSSHQRTVKVIGPPSTGKKTLMGTMLYMCGLDLRELEQLQKDGIDAYDKIIGYYHKNGLTPVFAAKSGMMRFADSPQADGLIYVLDATGSKDAILHSGQVFTQSECEMFKATGSLILVVNKMDAVDWSREKYEQVVAPAIQQLKSVGLSPEKIQVVPISAKKGDNILERSANSPWHRVAESSPQGDETSGTLFAYLDQI
ncbi:P-loop containing nucleoside triphosphate hydrolase protein [Macrophomina phaseolina]|uniref:P-loop containing nucleoside triphosphate hydrolase protein n=1 Tax=Macrophomina phaseolina TaxID=35725 RepID=A0ABQ8FXL0_9PEZI|nr:P-loop containing nucleoside triphosphate hydrolase protein [Macrophomina phaseolina]